MVKQTKKIKANSSKSTTTVANGEEFVKVDVNGQMTLIPLANLKTAIFGNMNVNAIEDGIEQIKKAFKKCEIDSVMPSKEILKTMVRGEQPKEMGPDREAK